MAKKKAKMHGTDIVDECPRRDRDKPTVTECTGRFTEIAMKEKKHSLCWKCPIGIITREEYSEITEEEQEDLEDAGEKVDINEDITAPPVKTRQRTLYQESSGVKKPPKEKTIMKKEEDASTVPTEQKVSCFLRVMANKVASNPHCYISPYSIQDRMEINCPGWKSKDLELIAELGLIELVKNDVSTTFCLTAKGIAQAGLQDIKPTALTPLVATPEEQKKFDARAAAAKKRAAAQTTSQDPPEEREPLTEEVITLFLAAMAKIVGDEVFRHVTIPPIDRKVGYHPWWDGRKTIAEIAKLGLLEISPGIMGASAASFTWFKLTKLGVERAGLKIPEQKTETAPTAAADEVAIQMPTTAPELTNSCDISNPPHTPPAPTTLWEESRLTGYISNERYDKLLAELKNISPKREFTAEWLRKQADLPFGTFSAEQVRQFLLRAKDENYITHIGWGVYRRCEMGSAGKNNSKPKKIQRAQTRRYTAKIYDGRRIGGLLKLQDIWGTGKIFSSKSEAAQFLIDECEAGRLATTSEKEVYEIINLPGALLSKNEAKKQVQHELDGLAKNIDNADRESVRAAILASFHTPLELVSVKDMRTRSLLLEKYHPETIAAELAAMSTAATARVARSEHNRSYWKLVTEKPKQTPVPIPPAPPISPPVPVPPPVFPAVPTAIPTTTKLPMTHSLQESGMSIMALLAKYDGQILPSPLQLAGGDKALAKRISDFLHMQEGVRFTIERTNGKNERKIWLLVDPNNDSFSEESDAKTGLTTPNANTFNLRQRSIRSLILIYDFDNRGGTFRRSLLKKVTGLNFEEITELLCKAEEYGFAEIKSSKLDFAITWLKNPREVFPNTANLIPVTTSTDSTAAQTLLSKPKLLSTKCVARVERMKKFMSGKNGIMPSNKEIAEACGCGEGCQSVFHSIYNGQPGCFKIFQENGVRKIVFLDEFGNPIPEAAPVPPVVGPVPTPPPVPPSPSAIPAPPPTPTTTTPTTQANPNTLTIKLDGPLSERSIRIIEATAKIAVILDGMEPDEAAAAIHAANNLIKT